MRSWRVAALALLAPMAALAGSATTAAAAADAARAVPGAVAPAPSRPDTALQRRVALLGAELRLDAQQRVRIEALLQRQREEVRTLWSDGTVPAALRIGRMQAISERTADAIRGVLDAEQRRRYIQPRQRDALVGAGGAGVEAWMAPEGVR